MKHKQKLNLARKLINGRVGISFIQSNGLRIKAKFSPFNSKPWVARREAIRQRVRRKQQATHQRAVLRRAAAKQ